MFLCAIGLVVALVLSCFATSPPDPPAYPINPTVPWYKCNHPGTEEVSEQYGQTVRSFRHCLNEDQFFKNSMCDRDVNPQAIKMRCMNNTFLPLPDAHDFDWWNAKCHDDEVCVDDTGDITWPFKASGNGRPDSVARCVKPADTAVVWSTNDARGKHRARWNMIGQDVNYTRLDYTITVHFFGEDFRTNGDMMHADLRVLDKRGLTVETEERIIPEGPEETKTYVGLTGLRKGWHQFEVWVDHVPKSYGFAFTIINKYAD